MTRAEELNNVGVYATPDYAWVDDKEIEYNEYDAYAFIYDIPSKRVFCRGYGISHQSIYDNSDYLQQNYTIDDIQSTTHSKIIQGRIWLNSRIMSFWCKLPSSDILKNIVQGLSEKLRINFQSDWVVNGAENEENVYMLRDALNGTVKLAYKYDVNQEDKIQDLKNIHLMKGDEKREYINDYLKDRNDNLGKKLAYSNDKDEMPLAQWRALHTTSESKKIYVSENQLSLLKEWYNRNISVNLNNLNEIDYQINEEYDEDEEGNEIKYYEYDIICYDYHQNIIYQQNNLDFDDLEELLGINIAKEIAESPQDSGTISDLLNTTPSNIDDANEVNEIAKKLFPPYDYEGNERGYILTDGTFIYFGGGVDHLSITSIDGMGVGKFVDLGNIRVNYDSFELAKEPTSQQRLQLKKLIANNPNKTLYVDIISYNGNGYYGNQITSASYVTHNPNIVLNEIDRFFDEGIKLSGGSIYRDEDDYYFEEKKIDKKFIQENLEMEIAPSEVDLSSFDKQDSLNDNIWQDEELDSKLRLKLLDIADDFIKTLGISWVKPKDILLTGSICDYNWSLFSDIDLHVIMDFRKIDKRVDFVKKYLDAKKNEWNNSHKELEIYGFPIEVYVQDVREKNESNGIYSLNKNKWLKKPNRYDIEELNPQSNDVIKRISAKVMNRIDSFYERFENCFDDYQLRKILEDVTNLSDKLKEYRKLSLGQGGQMSVGNIVYKVLRRMQYLDDLRELKNQIYDRLNSIDEI